MAGSKDFLAIALTAMLAFSCAESQSEDSTVKFDSAHSVALDVTIESAQILTRLTDDAAIEREITEQLMYTIGQLNGFGAGPDMNRLKISFQDSIPMENDLTRVTYAAQLFISWPRDRRVPANYQFIVPARGDVEGLNNFLALYGSDSESTKQCLANAAQDVTRNMFWYYYRPHKRTCPLTDGASEAAHRIQAQLKISAENTEGKYPEYHKVWEDDQLVATMIFGKNEAGATEIDDAGIASYRQLYRDLLTRFGAPVSSNLPFGEEPSAENDDLRLVFWTEAGTLDVHIYLVDSIRRVDANFVAKYNARTRHSDFVSYSGHSGLGANIRALANMGQFEPGQYQLFLINGCDTFAYVDNSLRDAHHIANPDYGPDKFFDIITNAMPSYFYANARSNMAVLDGLVSQVETYREILAKFDVLQRAAVEGEADNRWPEPFIEPNL